MSKPRSPRKSPKKPATPVIPLSQHRHVPAVLRELEGWAQKCSDKDIVGRLIEILDSDEGQVMGRLRGVLNRVVFHPPLPADFDSRKYHYLMNVLLEEVWRVVDQEPGCHVEREVVDIEEASRLIQENWASVRLTIV